MIGVFVALPGRKGYLGYVIQGDGCWEWTGARSRGYGHLWMPDLGRVRPAHRVIYEQMRGPIPAGLQIDHLCRNRACVNPDHMEVVSGRENTLRSDGLTAQNARKTHCDYGHPLNAVNTYRNPNRRERECRTCRAQRRPPYVRKRKSSRAA